MCIAVAAKASQTFILAGVRGAPAELEALTISRDKDSKNALYLESFVLRNTGSKEISKYQIGWRIEAEASDGLSADGLGPVFALKTPLRPSEQTTITHYPFDNNALAGGGNVPTTFSFFVAGATFTDGSNWKADTKQLSKKGCIDSLTTANDFPLRGFAAPCPNNR